MNDSDRKEVYRTIEQDPQSVNKPKADWAAVTGKDVSLGIFRSF